MNETQNAVVKAGLTRNQKVGLIVGATVLTAGIAYGVFKLVKAGRARRAEKANHEVAE